MVLRIWRWEVTLDVQDGPCGITGPYKKKAERDVTQKAMKWKAELSAGRKGSPGPRTVRVMEV